ncbi:hypothetical protein B5S28_g1742 [[Candida] boidinii]|nr:hypothetical protein B5S28_g1742 [[Candida] boidinii]OWB60784.1 hypothetical protein B5S29_g1665 [[Candida] boidinii]
MPAIDSELIIPLSKISEVLQKRPGKVSIEGIKRLSNLYGFETFTDTLAYTTTSNNIPTSAATNNNNSSVITGANNISSSSAEGFGADAIKATPLLYTVTASHSGTPNIKDKENQQWIDRLSLSGKTLLIDIDFQNNHVIKVSLSNAVNIIPLSHDSNNNNNNAGYNNNIIKGISFLDQDSNELSNYFDEPVETVENILYKNLQNKTLDNFNRNLRILSQFDKLSSNEPNDLFNFFNQLTYNLINISNYQSNNSSRLFSALSITVNKKKFEEVSGNQNLENDLKDGFIGIGKLIMNQHDKIGVFLKYWENNRFINRFIYENHKIKTNEMIEPFMVHFKIKERDIEEENESNPVNSNSSSSTSSSSAGISGNNNRNDFNDYLINDNENKINLITTFESNSLWFSNGKWLPSLKYPVLVDNFNSLVLELTPCVWIPKDLLLELGLNNYEVISEDNKNNYNDKRIFTKIDKLGKFYHNLNSGSMCQEFKINEDDESHQANDQNDNNKTTTENNNSESTIKINTLIGSKFIKLHKVVLNDISILENFFNSLRSWSFLNNLLTNLFENTITYEERNSNITNGNTDMKTSTNGSTSNNNNNDNYNYDDITINELIKRHLPELKNRENNRNPEVYKSENKLIINIESLYDYNNIITLKISNTEFIIKNGELLVTRETYDNNSETNNNNTNININNKKLGEILNKTEEIFEVFKAQNLI